MDDEFENLVEEPVSAGIETYKITGLTESNLYKIWVRSVHIPDYSESVKSAEA
jgi:hypothetical protein